MYRHHTESVEKLKEYFLPMEGMIAIVLDGSIVKGNERPDSDIDALIVVTEEKYRKLAAENRLAEVIAGHCTYEGGYFDVKYKTKAILQASALHASEPTRNAYVKARVLYSADPDVAPLVEKIAAYPEHELDAKIRCFNANLQLNRGYFLHCVPEENAYMRAHLAQEIVYSVYRLILAEKVPKAPRKHPLARRGVPERHQRGKLRKIRKGVLGTEQTAPDRRRERKLLAVCKILRRLVERRAPALPQRMVKGLWKIRPSI